MVDTVCVLRTCDSLAVVDVEVLEVDQALENHHIACDSLAAVDPELLDVDQALENHHIA